MTETDNTETDNTTRSTKTGVYPSPLMPMPNARLMLEDSLTANGMVTTRRQRDSWLEWSHDHWAEIEETRLRQAMYIRFEHARYQTDKGTTPEWSPTTRRVTDVMDALEALVYLHKDVQAPAWLDGDPAPDGVPANEVVACRNTLLHITTRKEYELTPALFNRVAVPFDYDPAAPEPAAWLAFLEVLWPGDQDSHDLLGEWFGYVLSGSTRLHKILLMLGPSRSGKGTIARVLQGLVGVGNYVGTSLASLGSQFGLEALVDKPLAILADARSDARPNAVTLERLLKISGDDDMSVDRKHRVDWNGIMPTRLVILSNELPQFGDSSAAIIGRFVTLTMTESFLGREDHALLSRLIPELPGILLWALAGLDRLVRNDNRFTVPQSSEQTVRTMHDLTSPIGAFLRDRCTFGPGHRVIVADLYDAWCAWCKEQGRDHPGNVQTFGRNLQSAAPGLRISSPRIGLMGAQVRCYDGIELKEPGKLPLCVLQDCLWVAADGSQFCTRHPQGSAG